MYNKKKQVVFITETFSEQFHYVGNYKLIDETFKRSKLFLGDMLCW